MLGYNMSRVSSTAYCIVVRFAFILYGRDFDNRLSAHINNVLINSQPQPAEYPFERTMTIQFSIILSWYKVEMLS